MSDERENVARELDKVVNWAQEYTADAAVRDADLLHIADYCIKFRNDGIKQAVRDIVINAFPLGHTSKDVFDYVNEKLKELESTPTITSTTNQDRLVTSKQINDYIGKILEVN